MKLALALLVVTSLSSAVTAITADAPFEITPTLDASGFKLTWRVGPHAPKLCTLEKKALKAQMSFDRSAVILSDTEFISMSNLEKCGTQPLKASQISSTVGSLVDVNVPKGLYLALDPINASPLSFLATVGRIGSSRNLVNLPGAYVEELSLAQLQEQGFAFNPETDPPRIAPNGRFVSPGGSPDCSDSAYPGVWDLTHNKRLVLAGSRQDHQSECDALFK